MGITTKTIRAKQGDHRVLLVVSLTSTAIHVAAGDVITETTQRTLPEAQEYTLLSRPQQTRVTGYLALQESDQSLVFLVDEFVSDGQDTPFVFAGSGYKELHALYDATVLPYVTDPADCEIHVWLVDDTFVAPEAEMRLGLPSGGAPNPLGAESLIAALKQHTRTLPRG